MTSERETAIRDAILALTAAIMAAVRDETTPVANAPGRLLSIDEAAAALGLGRTALYPELMSGRLRSFKVGRRRLIPASAIDAYIEARAGDPASAVVGATSPGRSS